MGKIMRNGVQYGVDTADILSTVAECDASASGGKGTTQVASAKALSELNSNLKSNVNELELNVNQLEANLGGVKFGIDSEGNYGYIKAGADTVTPFNIIDSFTVNVDASSSNPGSDYCTTTISNLENYTTLTATIKSTGYSGYKSYKITSSDTTLASGKDSGDHIIDISLYSSISFYSTSTNGRGHNATLTFS